MNVTMQCHWRAPKPNSGPINSISKDLLAALENLPQKRLQIWCRSLASYSNTTEKGSENEYDTLVTRASALLVALLPPLHIWQAHACTPKMMLGPPEGGVAGLLPRKILLLPMHHNSLYSPAHKCLPDGCRNTCCLQLPRHVAIVHGTYL